MTLCIYKHKATNIDENDHIFGSTGKGIHTGFGTLIFHHCLYLIRLIYLMIIDHVSMSI